MGDLLGDVGDVDLWIDAVELGDLDDGVERGRAHAAGLRSGEQPVLSAEGDAPAAHRPRLLSECTVIILLSDANDPDNSSLAAWR